MESHAKKLDGSSAETFSLRGRLFQYLEKITFLWGPSKSDEVLKSEPGTSNYSKMSS